VATGVLLGLLLCVRNSQRLGINPEDTWNLGIIVTLAGILGAKNFADRERLGLL